MFLCLTPVEKNPSVLKMAHENARKRGAFKVLADLIDTVCASSLMKSSL